MSNVLGLLYEDGFDKINSLLEKQSDELRVPFYVRKDLSYIMGETYSSDAFPYKVYIGTNGLQNNFSFLNHIFPISDQKFAQVIINIFHEATHCQQKNVMFQNDSPTQNDINQTISELACRGNKTYYMGQHNYIMNPNEIQAEYSGVTEAYQYLCTVFPDIDKKQHEQIILDVLNTKLQSGVSY